jgi:hypothetical protein
MDAFCMCTSLRGIDVPPTVMSIKAYAFQQCSTLTTVTLHDGLEEIEENTFCACTSLHEILIPNGVKFIKKHAFKRCTQLSSVVILGEGLEGIGEGSFRECTSIQSVILGEGLEEIGEWAFRDCTSLIEIVIPPAVKIIGIKAFSGCTNLTRVVFNNEIEEFVLAESMREWWNHGIHDYSLSTYCFLVKCDIPRRLGRVRPRKWQTSIHGMLRSIPMISPRRVTPYFDSIDSKLFFYESVEDFPTLLELAIWKAKITDQYDSYNNTITIDMKMRCRTDSVIMVTIIVPNVLSFLTDGNDCDDTFDSNDENNDDNHGDDDESSFLDNESSSSDEWENDESSDEGDNDDNDEQEDHNDEDEVEDEDEDGDGDGDGEGNRRQRRRLG